MGKVYNTSGNDVDLADAMLDNIEDLLIQFEASDLEETKKQEGISKLRFTHKFITGFKEQL